MKLRDYQRDLCIDIWEYFNDGGNKVIAQSPTGSGKNFMMGYICKQTHDRQGNVIFTVAGRNVVSQFTDSLNMFKVPWTYMMSGEAFHSHKPTWVSSIDTLQSWFFKPNAKYDKESLMIPDYFLFDECRLGCTKKRAEVIDFFAERGSKVIGFDATPKHKRIHLVWDHMIQGRSTPWHINNGDLAKVVHYAPSDNDEKFMKNLAELKTPAGDYKEDDLEDLMNKKVLVGEIVTNYERISMNEYGDFKPFTIACVNKKHARTVEDAFLDAGHKVAYIDADTPTEERMEMFEAIQNGDIIGIISVLTMIYGVDLPYLHIGINARPSKSVALFLQFGGRILRTHDDKSHATFIDHAGALREHGYLDDEFKFTLDPDNPVENLTEEERRNNEDRESPEVDITCSNCMHKYKNSPVCPKCGHENVIDFNEDNVVYVNTDLVKEHREAAEAEARSIEDWYWLSDMKAAVWANDKLPNDSVKVNVLNEMCNMKFGHHFNPTDLLALQTGKITEEAKRYYKYYHIRRHHARNKAKKYN